MAKHSIATQIAEVEAEIAMRRKVYPNQVARRAMREGEAELKIAIMGSVRATLLFCQQHEESIRTFIRSQQDQGGAEE